MVLVAKIKTNWMFTSALSNNLKKIAKNIWKY